MKRENKKKKAFTLIELLAVIVILAIIATIVTGTISKVTSNAKKQAFKESARGLIRAAESYIGQYILKNHQAPELPMTFTCDGTSCKYQDIELDFSGEIPKSGAIIADGLKRVEASYLSDGKYCAAGTKTDMQVADSCSDIDITKPIVTGEVEGKVLKLTLTDLESGIGAYCVRTTNDSSSCSWIETTDSYKEHTVLSAGTYYVFAKDKKGNISNSVTLSVIVYTLGEKILLDNPTRYTNPTLTNTFSNTTDAIGLYSMSVTNGFGGQSTEGTTYYFRGNVNNNYVTFAEKTWRIVRINEDGTVRLILSNSIGDYKYKSSGGSYTYMYYTNSDIKGTIESWYSTNITGNDNAKVVEGNYFCEAAKVKRDNGWNSGGNTNNPSVTEYTPNLTCITDGNSMGLLNLKVGLLTYEEYCYAGGHANNQGTSLYLWDNTSWWTMSPMGYLNNGYVSTAGIGVTLTDGRIYFQYPHGDNLKTRPVINLDKDVTVTGTGTSTDPYVVE